MQLACILLVILAVMQRLGLSGAIRVCSVGRSLSSRAISSSRLQSAGGAGTGGDTVVSRCTAKLTAALSPTRLKVSAQHDDPNGSHIAIECVSAAFEGKAAVMRQRLVYKAIWDEMADGGAVHAVDQIIAKTPAEDAGGK